MQDWSLLAGLDNKTVSGKQSVNTGHAGFLFFPSLVGIFSFFTGWFPARAVIRDYIECILLRLGFPMELLDRGLEVSDLLGMAALNCWPWELVASRTFKIFVHSNHRRVTEASRVPCACNFWGTKVVLPGSFLRGCGWS